MMRMFKGVVAAGLVLPMLAGGSFAQAAESQTGTNASADKAGTVSPQGQAVEHAALAADLVAYGRQARSPMALILAAQLQGEVGGVEQARTKTSDAAAGKAPAAKPGKPETTPATLYAEARALAGSDRALISQIDRASASAGKGRVGGPTTHEDRVLARATDTYNISFRGGEAARLAVLGDGDTDLDLYVYDNNDNLICSDTDGTDQTYCGWTPAWTGDFKVRIRNLGSVYNSYTIMTN